MPDTTLIGENQGNQGVVDIVITVSLDYFSGGGHLYVLPTTASHENQHLQLRCVETKKQSLRQLGLCLGNLLTIN